MCVYVCAVLVYVCVCTIIQYIHTHLQGVVEFTTITYTTMTTW